MVNKSFFKFFFGFIAVLAVVLSIIFIAGAFSGDPKTKSLEVQILDQRANK